MNTIKKLKLHKLISILVIAIGCLLMMYMIFAEDEPGAIPLLLIGVGSGWYFFTRFNIRSQQVYP